MQHCGLCSALAGLARRAVCGGSRRGSTDSYNELAEQETLKIEDKSSDSEDSSSNSLCPLSAMEAELEGAAPPPRAACTGRFLTMHKRRKRRLLTRSLCQEPALLDDVHSKQIQCILDQSVRWRFNAFTLDNVSGGRSLPVLCVHLFQRYGLMQHYELEAARVWKLFCLIEEGYHGSNPYHNHVHAADVTQAMHCFLQQPPIGEFLEPLEIMASLIGSIAHDVDHPGVNQPFLIATSNHLASLYENTSVLENHHWRWAMSCLAESGVADHVPGLRAQLAQHISSLILATDITRQQEFLERFKEHLDKNSLDMRGAEHRHLVLQIALKCADISNPCRPWDISRRWSVRVCEEFFRQGDCERRLKLPVTALCDRRTTSVPKIQAGFFQFVVTPLVTQWHRFLRNSLSEQMLYNLQYNRSKWERLLAREMAPELAANAADSDEELYAAAADSCEALLPRRRRAPSPPSPAPQPPPRRRSVPLAVILDAAGARRSSLAGARLPPAVHPQLEASEKVLSSETLLPDSSIASITTPAQASRLSCVLGRLLRQQTFPPLAAAARPRAARGLSHDAADGDAAPGRLILGEIMAQFELERSERAGAALCAFDADKESWEGLVWRWRQAGRRESAPAPPSHPPATFTKEQLLRRRKSMPTAADVIHSLVGAAGLRGGGGGGGGGRRGSAPVAAAAGELRALVGAALRPGAAGGRRRLSREHQCLLRPAHLAGLRRRSSLPVEVLTGT